MLCCAQAFAQPLDDISGLVNLEPDTSLVLACTPVSLTVYLAVTDARVFELHFALDPARLQLLSIAPGPESTLHVMPPTVAGSQVTLDAFFEPNYSGQTHLVTFNFYVNPTSGDDSTIMRFWYGEGYAGTAENPVPIVFSGDSALIRIEGTPPLPPGALVITPLAEPATLDSILLSWNPAFYDASGDTVINPLYVVYRQDLTLHPGIYDSIYATPDTFFYDDFKVFSLNPADTGTVSKATLKVVTRKTQP